MMVLMFCAQWTENDKQTEQQCPTVPSWDPAQRDLSHRSFPQSLSIMLLLFSSCRESPNNFLPIVWQTWLCAVSGCHQSAVTMDRHSRHTGRCRPPGPCRHCSVQRVTCHHLHCCMLHRITGSKIIRVLLVYSMQCAYCTMH